MFFFYFVTQILSRKEISNIKQLLDSFDSLFIIKIMSKIFFRQTESSDVQTIEQIEQKLFKNPWNQNNIGESIANPLNYSELAEIAGEAAGYIIYSTNRFEAELLRIGVIEKFRRMGLAASLLRRMFNALSKRGISEVFLEVNENNPALIFYNKNGFTETGRRKNYYGNENAIIMKAMVCNENNKS